jgi:phospholipid-binding lipoprotein MlaA
MHDFNMAVDKGALRPTASVYRGISPPSVRGSISNFLENLKEPFYLVNYLLIADLEYATNSLFRFILNSSLGILGLFDVGKHLGLVRKETSYKNTLKTWGMPTGDYIVLPILGPSSTRDTVMEPIAWFLDPVSYFIGFPWMLGKTVFSMVHGRAENMELIDSTMANSVDFYLTTKSLYEQKYGSATPAEEEYFDDDTGS